MSSLTFLTSELQSLSSETRRKNPEIRDATEKALSTLRAIPDQSSAILALDAGQSEELLRPIFMACTTKNAKTIAISFSCLQRLLALQAVSLGTVPRIIGTMNDCMNQGVDIQLRILQTLLSLITNFTTLHGALLGDALILCFKMQESRIAVVSSTAAATLRQIVMFIIDKVVDEDRKHDLSKNDLTELILPDNSKAFLGPSALDAYSVVEDLCLLANTEKPRFLKLGSLPKTFALELIESVMTNYHDLFRNHAELVILLRHYLCPLLLKLLSDRPIFPLTLRSTRVVFLLLKQFSCELPTEVEVFFALLLKIIGGDAESDNASSSSSRPIWMRVLALEIVRGLCNDAQLMRRIWEHYDSAEGGTKLFTSLVSTLNRLIAEKPALLGVSSQMFGVGVSSHPFDDKAPPSATGYGFDLGSVAGMVANAASVTVTNVVGMMGAEHGLSVDGSSMRLQCIDQLDKADAPPIPDSYVYLLGLQCLVSICDGLASSTHPILNAIILQRARSAGEASVKAPAALDVTSIADDQSTVPLIKQHLRAVHGMIERGWPGLLAALSFIIATNISDSLFGDVLQSYLNIANIAGALGLKTPCDAFLTNLAKFAIPSRVVSSIEAFSFVEPPTPRTAGIATNSSFSESIGAVPGTTTQPPGLSERNLACLKGLVMSASFLAGSLGSSWFDILETLQNAEYVLTSKGHKVQATKQALNTFQATATSSRSSQSPNSSSSTQSTLLSDVDGESVQKAIQKLFESTKVMDDVAFHDFVFALCRLSSEMIDMQSSSNALGSPVETEPGSKGQTSSSLNILNQDSVAHRRRASGIHLQRTLRTGDFSINKIGIVSRLNVARFTHRPPKVAWDVVTGHLLTVLRSNFAPHSIRLQAAHTLDNDILLLMPRSWGSSEHRRSSVQRLVLDAVEKQVAPSPDLPGIGGGNFNSTTLTEIRKLGQETLLQILQSAGHTIIVGWECVFSILSSACEPSFLSSPWIENSMQSPLPTSKEGARSKPQPLGYHVPPDKGSSALIRVAFQSLTLVCDSLAMLSPDHMKLCISTLGRFGRQIDTNIALTATGSLMWGVSDSLQAKRKDGDKQEAEYSDLWMFLLLEVLKLCTDPRLEVRGGAIQTLFRTLQLYGSTLNLETWDEVLWRVTFPLLDRLTEIRRSFGPTARLNIDSPSLGLKPSESQAWDESKSLAFQSIGTTFSDFLIPKVMQMQSFKKVCDVFVQHVHETFLYDSVGPRLAALRCLERTIKATELAPPEYAPKVEMLQETVWLSCDEMGRNVVGQKSSMMLARLADESVPEPFEQDTLLAYVDVIQAIRPLGGKAIKREWPLERLSRLLEIIKGVLTYPDSPTYRPDVDVLTPVQARVVGVIDDIDLAVTGAVSLILRDFSEFITLPFLAAFESRPFLEGSLETDQIPRRVTYVGLTKKVIPALLVIFAQFKDNASIYEDGTVEAILSAYGVPMKLKYECPSSSKSGKDAPLWKTATTSFLQIVKDSLVFLRTFQDLSDERLNGIWRQIIEGFQGGILADCSYEEALPLEERFVSEAFDFSIIASLETDVLPFLGDTRVPDSLVVQLASALQKGSQLYHVDLNDEGMGELRSPSASEISSISHSSWETGTTAAETALSRERFPFWCLDLLFSICSDEKKDEEASRRRIAFLSLPLLLSRCRSTLLSFLSDEAVRGNYPVSRIREAELVHILQNLLNLRLWPDTLKLAFSGTGITVSPGPLGAEAHVNPTSIMADAVKISPKAHLFYLYGPLCRIAALSRKTPISWDSCNLFVPYATGESGKAKRMSGDENKIFEELDARSLAAASLEVIGQEWGFL